jgi:hypothetical protein
VNRLLITICLSVCCEEEKINKQNDAAEGDLGALGGGVHVARPRPMRAVVLRVPGGGKEGRVPMRDCKSGRIKKNNLYLFSCHLPILHDLGTRRVAVGLT